MLEELLDVFSRRKFAERFERLGLTPVSFVAQFQALVEIVDSIELAVPVSADPADDAVLACAAGGRADYIVSGDKHLLEPESMSQGFAAAGLYC